MHVIYTGAHGGFESSPLPLGGGATVMNALAREWARTSPFKLTVLGVGDALDLPNILYVRLPIALAKPLTDLGELEYGRFSRKFERATTDWVRTNLSCPRPEPTVVLSNDISEGPAFRALAALELPIATIFHVDVVEFVAKFYCRGWIKPEWLTRLLRWQENWHLTRLLPDAARLVFEKQADCVRYSQKLILPSKGMSNVLRRCSPGCDSKIEVIPWGAIAEAADFEIPDLKSEFSVSHEDIILLTLCRLSPEKGVDRLLRALIGLEKKAGASLARRIRLFLCGSAAYMQGQAYLQKLQSLAAKLRTIRVCFVGHVSGGRKRAFFQLADLYVHLSYHESYGLTIAEAMRAGCPVLTTDHHGARDLVPPECGRIVSGGTEETVAALQAMLSDPPRLRVMGAAAAEHTKRLSFTDAASRLAEVLRKLAPVQVSL